jgi:hypothetical protein
VQPKENSLGPSRELAGESRRQFWDAHPAGDHVAYMSKSRLYRRDTNAGSRRLNDGNGFALAGPPPRQEDPKQSMYWAEAWASRRATVEHRQLMAQRDALPNQIVAGTSICSASLRGRHHHFVTLCPTHESRQPPLAIKVLG